MEKYFDCAATTPMTEAALGAFTKAAREFYGNTSSVHDVGTKAHSLLEHSRETLAGLLGVEASGLFFTSGGTESNWLGMEAMMSAGGGNHLILSAAEHSSIRRVVEKKEREGWSVTRVPLTDGGMVDLKSLEEAITAETVVVSVQLVNSDIGTIQPLNEIHSLCKRHNLLLHSDFVQAFGKIDVREAASFVDSFSLSAHKIGGPKGVGALYIRPSLSFEPIFPSVTHESGVRPGTVNTPGVASFIVAADSTLREDGILDLKTTFLKQLREDFEVVGDVRHQSVPIVGLLVKGVPGQWMVLEGSRHGYAFSTGSACQSGMDGTLPTLDAMGMTEEDSEVFIRISFHPSHTKEDVIHLADCLNQVVVDYSGEKVEMAGR
ncbi:IscS subfamily cysteine desulfurase [Halobacillus litoralis]|uniref:IscS subfamily cysteine desulfurase n=1 Tax=Halobacillus litoralis TaxID=45668 RepID=UPI001CD7E0A0|nr:IscS subfamily cysteine desulfurase [Halobacillus litoralis]MCA0972515.1 IscS subfamily cysteine desulfurase [Halobacillus litoralis]